MEVALIEGGPFADIFQALQDGGAYTLEELHRITGHSPACVVSQLYCLRQRRYGAFIVQTKSTGRGVAVYRLALRPDGKPARAGDDRG